MAVSVSRKARSSGCVREACSSRLHFFTVPSADITSFHNLETTGKILFVVCRLRRPLQKKDAVGFKWALGVESHGLQA